MPSPRPITRRSLLRAALYSTLAASTATLGGLGYVTKLEPAWLKTERIRVPIANLPAAFDGYRIAQLSDLHISDAETRDRASAAVRRAIDLAPDLIVITGDFVTHWVDPGIVDVLAPLTAPDGVLAIMGNHDHWTNVDEVRRHLADTPLIELRNASTTIERENQQLYIAGLDDIWENKHDLASALASIPPDAPTILLAHEPDYADAVFPLNRISLQLSGHSHGGQVRVPGLGSPIVPHLGNKYVRGLRKLGSMWLYTNRGVGSLGYVPVRFNCRPEVTEITLTRT